MNGELEDEQTVPENEDRLSDYDRDCMRKRLRSRIRSGWMTVEMPDDVLAFWDENPAAIDAACERFSERPAIVQCVGSPLSAHLRYLRDIVNLRLAPRLGVFCVKELDAPLRADASFAIADDVGFVDQMRRERREGQRVRVMLLVPPGRKVEMGALPGDVHAFLHYTEVFRFLIDGILDDCKEACQKMLG